jgi:hypothetical protein
MCILLLFVYSSRTIWYWPVWAETCCELINKNILTPFEWDFECHPCQNCTGSDRVHVHFVFLLLFCNEKVQNCAIYTSAMSGHSSICPRATTWKLLDIFKWNFLLVNFKSCVRIPVLLKSDDSTSHFTWGPTCVSVRVSLNIYQGEKWFQQWDSTSQV